MTGLWVVCLVSLWVLLTVCHEGYDALLATGFSQYIIRNMDAPVRWSCWVNCSGNFRTIRCFHARSLA